MRFSLEKPAAGRPDGKALRSILSRAQHFDWRALGIDTAPRSLGACLRWDPVDIDALAADYAAAAERVASAYPARPRRSGTEPPAQQPWLRATAVAYEPCAELQQELGVPALELGEQIDRDVAVRTLQLYAARGKDGALDARLMVRSFGVYAISLVLDGLRKKVAQLGEAAAEPLLAAFAPMLVVIGHMMDEQAGKTGETKAVVSGLKTELADAEATRDEIAADITRRKELRAGLEAAALAPRNKERPRKTKTPPKPKGPPKTPTRRSRSR